MRQPVRWPLWLGLFLVGCSGSGKEKRDAQVRVPPDPYSQACLVDITVAAGIDFVHYAGPTDDYAMPQIMGSGACLFDFDNDNDLDVLLIGGAQSGNVGSAAGGSVGSRLYRQGEGGLFEDVTSSSGLIDEGYGMGAAVGDIDNDGDLDLYLTRYGEDRLYRNEGSGKFEEIGQASGIANPQWGTAASFVDYDRDGWLDLVVVNYVDFFPGSQCEDGAGRRDYCGPESLAGTVTKLYRNLGADREQVSDAPQFQDVTVAAGLTRRVGKGLGLLCRDFDGDGRIDFFVANDGEENSLWIQHDNGIFSNEALLRGVALNRFGEAEANMGIVAEDFNNDGWSDLFLTHLRQESNTLYRGAEYGQFSDATVASGFSVASLPFTSFGVCAADLDFDGAVDLAIVNGGVKRGPVTDTADVDEFYREYAQRNEIYMNDGQGQFNSQQALGGSDFARRVEVSRALASGDIDNDGDVDLLVSNCAGPARLYRNDFPKRGAWLRVTAADAKLKRAAIGAQISVRVGDRWFHRDLNPSSGYLSVNDTRVHFGLGKASSFDAIQIFWPDGSGEVEEFAGGPIDRQVDLVRGTGRIVAGAAQ